MCVRPSFPPSAGEWQGVPVAIKTMVFSAGVGKRRKQVLSEAAMAQAVAHPHIVYTYTVDVQPVLPAGGGGPGAAAAGAPEPPMVSCQTNHGEHMYARAGDGIAEPALTYIALYLQDWRLYIVQELCDGGPLRQALVLGSLWKDGQPLDAVGGGRREANSWGAAGTRNNNVEVNA